ncbi:MAG: AgmX/PglI C-terminal domain-containing protein [Myxococcota bacterium]
MADEKSPFDDVPEMKQEYEPREDTRAVILSAGIHRQAAKNRQVGLAIAGVLLVAGVIVGLDAAGIVQLLPEKMVPSFVAAEEEEIQPAPLDDPKSSSKLRDKLLGLNAPTGAAPSAGDVPTAKPKSETVDARSLFEDEDKAPKQLSLNAAKFRAEVALPDGLTGEAIQKVVQDNAGATRLCIAEAMRAGETTGGKAEFDLAIAPSGAVESVGTRTSAFKGSRLASCMERRMTSWRFPSFEGAPVVVVIPYVITQGI